jgi:hypothetical protein
MAEGNALLGFENDLVGAADNDFRLPAKRFDHTGDANPFTPER